MHFINPSVRQVSCVDDRPASRWLDWPLTLLWTLSSRSTRQHSACDCNAGISSAVALDQTGNNTRAVGDREAVHIISAWLLLRILLPLDYGRMGSSRHITSLPVWRCPVVSMCIQPRTDHTGKATLCRFQKLRSWCNLLTVFEFRVKHCIRQKWQSVGFGRYIQAIIESSKLTRIKMHERSLTFSRKPCTNLLGAAIFIKLTFWVQCFRRGRKVCLSEQDHITPLVAVSAMMEGSRTR